MRRSKRLATMSLHWTLLPLVYLLGGGLLTPTLEWIFAIVSLSMCALAIAFGLQAHAGPKSHPFVRLINTWGHRALYACLAILGGLALFKLTAAPNLDLSRLYRILLWVTIFHVIYHLWRQLIWRDDALRTMMPTALYKLM